MIERGTLQRINYHHLQYFWLVAKEGSLGNAAKIIRLSPPTLSGQIRTLEETVGHKLFAKQGRRLVLTEVGQITYRYADEIFNLGRELADVLARGVLPTTGILDIGLVEVVPKLIVRHLLEPVFDAQPPPRLVCHEGTLDHLAVELAAHRLDLVFADAPLPPGSSLRAYNHLLGESDVTFFAVPEMAKRLRGGFPESLHDAPMLIPLAGSALRRELEGWFLHLGIVPRLIAELEDSALLKALGAEGRGVFCAPTVVEEDVIRMYGVEAIASTREVIERFYVITPERRIRNPAALAISDAARTRFLRSS